MIAHHRSPAIHYIELSPDNKYFVDMSGSTFIPTRQSLQYLHPASAHPIWTPKSLDSLGYTPIPSETFALKVKDGTILYAHLTLPLGQQRA